MSQPGEAWKTWKRLQQRWRGGRDEGELRALVTDGYASAVCGGDGAFVWRCGAVCGVYLLCRVLWTAGLRRRRRSAAAAARCIAGSAAVRRDTASRIARPQHATDSCHHFHGRDGGLSEGYMFSGADSDV